MTDEISCPDLVEGTLLHTPGILGVGLNTAVPQLTLDYNPQLLSQSDLQTLSESISPQILGKLFGCMRMRDADASECEPCFLQRKFSLEGGQYSPALVDPTGFSIDTGVGINRSVEEDGTLRWSWSNPLQVRDAVRSDSMRYVIDLESDIKPSRTGAEDGQSISRSARIRRAFTPQRLAALLTVVTLLAMIAGLLSVKAGAPEYVSNVLYAIAYLAGGAMGFKAGIESLIHLRLDIDLLMILAALGAWVVGAPFEGAMLLFLFSLSNVLQSFALDRTRAAIRSLIALRPAEALVRRGGRKIILPIESIRLNDLVIVRPGERIPVDGEVVEGASAIDQSPITGESVPIDVLVGSQVLSGSINQEGGLEVKVTRLAEDSTIARMITLVEEARSQKARTQQFIEVFEKWYAWVVILGTTLAIALPTLVLQEPFDETFYRAMMIMVAASPCALVISTPAAILSAIGNGARRGILFKGGVHLEQAARIKVVAFDKTGTLTEGRPQVTRVYLIPNPNARWSGDENELLSLAAAVEAKSEHPLGKAIVQVATARGLHIPEASEFQASLGLGVKAKVGELIVSVGNRKQFEHIGPAGEAGDGLYQELEQSGVSPVLVSIETPDHPAELAGVIGIADRVRPTARETVQELKALGLERIVMLTGDNPYVAQAIAQQAGVDTFFASLMPEDKVSIVRQLQEEYGPVAMIGDGINDAPALATSDLGVAMGAAGTDVALETADVVLLSDTLERIPHLFALSRRTQRILRFNLVFAMAMITVMLVAILGATFTLPLAVLGHEGGTVLVSLNGLLLLLFRHRRKRNLEALGQSSL